MEGIKIERENGELLEVELFVKFRYSVIMSNGVRTMHCHEIVIESIPVLTISDESMQKVLTNAINDINSELSKGHPLPSHNSLSISRRFLGSFRLHKSL